MITKQAPKPSPEYISHLQERYDLWSRSTDESGIILSEIEAMLEKFKKDAYIEEKYEAFAHIDRIIEYIRVVMPAKLKNELELCKRAYNE